MTNISTIEKFATEENSCFHSKLVWFFTFLCPQWPLPSPWLFPPERVCLSDPCAGSLLSAQRTPLPADSVLTDTSPPCLSGPPVCMVGCVPYPTDTCGPRPPARLDSSDSIACHPKPEIPSQRPPSPYNVWPWDFCLLLFYFIFVLTAKVRN